MKDSQKVKIINLLDDGRWHCTSEFYAMYIADPRKRLHELREQKKPLEWRWCESHDFHAGQQKEWRLAMFTLIQENINQPIGGDHGEKNTPDRRFGTYG